MYVINNQNKQKEYVFLRRVILDAGYENSAFELKSSFFGKHLKECVAIAYFQWLVNRKQEKRCEFYRKYLGASYFPAAVWHLKEGSSWMQGTKIQHSNSKILILASI
jgi:hypothetical protein